MSRKLKLVRDRVPDIIRSRGGDPVVTVAKPSQYPALLREKLEEEVAEYLASGDPAELADILEVVYALALDDGTGAAGLDALRALKARSNGTFTRRLVWHGNH